ncbi:ion transporter [Thiovibrio sp. JS02]
MKKSQDQSWKNRLRQIIFEADTPAASFYGIVDLLAVIPTHVSILIPGSQSLIVVRILRLLGVFRVFTLGAYLSEATITMTALWASLKKISVFLSAVLTTVVIIGSLMYVIEGKAHGFTCIPPAIYRAILTLTTVGYGDILPQTPLGKALASVVMGPSATESSRSPPALSPWRWAGPPGRVFPPRPARNARQKAMRRMPNSVSTAGRCSKRGQAGALPLCH